MADAIIENLKASFGSLSPNALSKATEEFLRLANEKLASETGLLGPLGGAPLRGGRLRRLGVGRHSNVSPCSLGKILASHDGKR